MSAPRNNPPPIPKSTEVSRRKIKMGLLLVPAIICAILLVLSWSGLMRNFKTPASSMAPAISPGDRVVMEGLTYLGNSPARGDVIVFDTTGIPLLPQGQFYVKRVVGLPGDHLVFSNGQLYVNQQAMTLSNAQGPIDYSLPATTAALTWQTNVTVPKDCYFVVGDNATNSYDSRAWGPLPKGNIQGRVRLCYWPLSRSGAVK